MKINYLSVLEYEKIITLKIGYVTLFLKTGHFFFGICGKKLKNGNIAFAHSKSSFAHKKKFYFPGIVICTRKKGFSI